VVDSQINEHVENHIHSQNVGFFAFQAPDVAGSLRKCPYPQLNPRVNCVGFVVDKVELEQVFSHVLGFFCAIYHSKKCIVHICYLGAIEKLLCFRACVKLWVSVEIIDYAVQVPPSVKWILHCSLDEWRP
jgi:hypothetical protein